MSASTLLFRLRLMISSGDQKKLLILNALVDVLRNFLAGHWSPDRIGAEKVFLLLLIRFADCLDAIHHLTNIGLSRQAHMVDRHALECAVYLGAIASKPNLYEAITSQEIYQRKKLRASAAQIGIITHEERQRMDQISAQQIQPCIKELNALKNEVIQEKIKRGWANTATSNELTITDLALCSEIFDIFKLLYRNLNMSAHVFFGTLEEDHVRQAGSVVLISSVKDQKLIQPVIDAFTLTGHVLKQADKLFGTSLFKLTDEFIVTHWPASD